MARGIFSGGNVFGGLGADPSEAGSGETEWEMDWASGEEATPVTPQVLDLARGLVSSVSRYGATGAAAAPMVGAIGTAEDVLRNAAGLVFGMPRETVRALTLGQVLTSQSLIPGVPNWAVGGGVATLTGVGLWKLFGSKKGKKGKAK